MASEVVFNGFEVASSGSWWLSSGSNGSNWLLVVPGRFPMVSGGFPIVFWWLLAGVGGFLVASRDTFSQFPVVPGGFPMDSRGSWWLSMASSIS